jgi:hypothetical protein
MWLTLLIALLVAIMFTMPMIWLLGWRRPGAVEQESAVLSGIFLFVLVFLATWALAGWLSPWGPAFSGVPWLLVLIGAAFVALLVLVAAPAPRYATASDDTARVGEAAEGIGLLFWLLVILLLVVGVIGNTRMGW